MIYAITLIASIACFVLGLFLALPLRNTKRGKPKLSSKHFFTALTIFVFGGGFVGFVAGVLGPIIFTPGANQGPLLGILFTGPLGSAIGLIGFVIYSTRKEGSQSGSRE